MRRGQGLAQRRQWKGHSVTSGEGGRRQKAGERDRGNLPTSRVNIVGQTKKVPKLMSGAGGGGAE